MNEEQKSGIELIAAERAEQIEKHGRTVEMDVVSNNAHQLIIAAANLCYLGSPLTQDSIDARTPYGWSKDEWRRMMQKPFLERVTIAAALLAAEIDREQFIANNKRVTEDAGE